MAIDFARLTPEAARYLARIKRVRRTAAPRPVVMTGVVDPPRYVLDIDGWRPCFDNELFAVHWTRRRKMKADDAAQMTLAARVVGIPAATTRRRVKFTIWTPYTSKAPDETAVYKSGLDALVHAGLLVDDNAAWCEIAKPEYHRGPRRTRVEMEDLR